MLGHRISRWLEEGELQHFRPGADRPRHAVTRNSAGLFSLLWAIHVVYRHFWPTITPERYNRDILSRFVVAEWVLPLSFPALAHNRAGGQREGGMKRIPCVRQLPNGLLLTTRNAANDMEGYAKPAGLWPCLPRHPPGSHPGFE